VTARKRRRWIGWLAVDEFGVRGQTIYSSSTTAAQHGEPVHVEMIETRPRPGLVHRGETQTRTALRLVRS